MSFGDAALAPDLPKAEVGTDPRPFAAEVGAGLAPGSGLADAAGVFPSFTNEEQQYYDGLITNIQNGQYGMAAMQGLAMLGDAMWAGGPLAGAVGTVGKMPLALSRAIARNNSTFQHIFKGSKIVDPTDGGPLLVFHGTRRNFPRFDPEVGELGSHFGTLPQAHTFTGESAWGQAIPEGVNIRTGYLRIKNPLRLVDKGTFDPTTRGLQMQLEDVGISARIVDPPDFSVATINRTIQRRIRAEGYDGVVYLNRHEGIDRQFKRPPEMTADAWERHLNGISDAEFRAIFPEAQESYIIFDPDQFINAFGIAP